MCGEYRYGGVRGRGKRGARQTGREEGHCPPPHPQSLLPHKFPYLQRCEEGEP